MRLKSAALFFSWAAFLLYAAGCSEPCAQKDAETVASGPLSYYCFGAELPKGGFCESQVFGKGRLIAEPVNLIFSLFAAAIGVAAMFSARRTSVIFQVLYSLLIAWGVFAALYHLDLANGMYRMMDVAISFLQAFVAMMLIHSLAVYRAFKTPKNNGRGAYTLSSIFTIVFTLYPAAVHVAGESSADPWVAWLVFDLLWGVIIVLLALISRRRKTWPNTDAERGGFRLAWHAVGYCVAAYGAWSLDKFACSEKTPFLAYLGLHGWWHFFMALCFFSLIGLCRYLVAGEHGCLPVLKRFPKRLPWGIYLVNWEPKKEIKGSVADSRGEG